MSRRSGQTKDRYLAMKADLKKKIAEENIRHSEWCRYAVETYDITTRRAEMLWSESWKELREKFQNDAGESLVQSLARLDALYADSRKSGYDYNTQLNILREIHKIKGLHIDRQEVTSTNKLSFDFQSDNAESDIPEEN